MKSNLDPMRFHHLMIATLTLAIAHPAATYYFQHRGETPQEKCIEATLATYVQPNAKHVASAHQLCR